jgi:hypothetical protein
MNIILKVEACLLSGLAGSSPVLVGLKNILKVHKNEKFFGSDFEICTFCNFFDWAIIVGDTIFRLV